MSYFDDIHYKDEYILPFQVSIQFYSVGGGPLSGWLSLLPPPPKSSSSSLIIDIDINLDLEVFKNGFL